MNLLASLLTLLVGVNASYDLARNIRESKESKRKKLVERAGRERPRAVARKLERLGGPEARVRHGLDDDGDPAVVVLDWEDGAPPTTFMGYPVLYLPGPEEP